MYTYSGRLGHKLASPRRSLACMVHDAKSTPLHDHGKWGIRLCDILPRTDLKTTHYTIFMILLKFLHKSVYRGIFQQRVLEPILRLLTLNMPLKQRIRLEQRRALRVWAHQQHPKPLQKACITWFHERYGFKISQSTVSKSLSSHFEAIDTSGNSQRSRLRTGQWPDLENLLFL
jgi:hypothetical protein